MTAEIHDQRFRQVVGGEIVFEKLATGFRFTEGPISHSRARHLTFSDIPGDQMHRWSAAGGAVSFRKPSNKANGNTYDRSGRMLSCEHATSRVTQRKPTARSPSSPPTTRASSSTAQTTSW